MYPLLERLSTGIQKNGGASIILILTKIKKVFFVQGSFSPGGIMSGGVLVRVVFVQMVFVRGGFCPTPTLLKAEYEYISTSTSCMIL